MRALKLAAQVESDHALGLELPEDVPEGPAEVIVLVPDRADAAPADPQTGSLAEFLNRPRVDPRFIRSKQEIDTHLRAERESWD